MMAAVDDTITLTAALKLAGMADTGGQAKRLIQAGRVRVNGAIETRRKRRLVAGDEIEFAGEVFVLEHSAAADPESAQAGSGGADAGSPRKDHDLDEF